MRCITLWQPYASAIAYGLKSVENRTWAPPESILGERIAIHAGAKKRDLTWGLPDVPGIYELDEPLPRSAVVCTCIVLGSLDLTNPKKPKVKVPLTLARFHDRMLKINQDPWWVGPVGWLVAEVRSLAVPVPCAGAMGLWNLSPDVERQVLDATRYTATPTSDANDLVHTRPVGAVENHRYYHVKTPRDERCIFAPDELDAIETARQMVERDYSADRYLARPDPTTPLQLVSPRPR